MLMAAAVSTYAHALELGEWKVPKVPFFANRAELSVDILWLIQT